MAVTYSSNGIIIKAPPTDVATSRRIDSEQGILVVDQNGYIGEVITDYFPHAGNTYYNNFAVVVNNANFSNSWLGQVTFITPGTTDIGGRTYRTVNIGGVEWLAENLDYKFSGCSIGPTGNPSSPAAWYYNNDESTYDLDGERPCGLLYNGYAASLLEANKSILCPGWHLPTKMEWEALMTAVGGTSTAGKVLKASNLAWATRWGGTDDYGFSAMPGGYKTNNDFYAITTGGNYWTATTYGTENNYSIQLGTFDNAMIINNPFNVSMSIRLVRDAT